MEMDNDAEAPQATPLASFLEIRDENLPEKGEEPEPPEGN